jgi:hypothetical protein
VHLLRIKRLATWAVEAHNEGMCDDSRALTEVAAARPRRARGPAADQESKPILYQAFWVMNSNVVPLRSRSVPLVTCGFRFES